jgi:hypothetical protein
MATITGGVFTKQSSSSLTYKMKCDKCGTVEQSENQIGMVYTGATTSYTRSCSKCSNKQKIIIKG